MDVYIYGGGSMGFYSSRTLIESGVNVKAVIDKNPDLVGKSVNGINIVGLNDIPHYDKLNDIFAIAIVQYPFNEIKKVLEDAGCKNIIYVGDLINSVYDGPSIANTWKFENITKEEKIKLSYVYNFYSDEASRKAFKQIENWLKNRVEIIQPEGMCPFNSKYFIDRVLNVLTDDEVFIDCGSYDGSSIIKIIKYTENKYKKIYAFEPGKENYSKLEYFIEESRLQDNVNFYNFGLGNIDGKKKFTSKLSLTSRYSDEFGDVYCEIRKIDSIMKDIPYTFLKIYGIGNGLDVIKGGIDTINKYRPIIVSNINHSRYNFVNIPCFLMNNLKDYNFYLRLHGYAGSDAVIYAIPKERENES